MAGLIFMPRDPHTMPTPISRQRFLHRIAALSLAGAAFAINCLVEREIDSRMARTARRPMARGEITVAQTLMFSGVIGGMGMWVLYALVNPLTMWLTLATFVGYAIIYTIILKPSTPQNIVIGGAAGAFPPVIGWACVTGSVPVESIVLFLIIFLWTPAHFWALALFKMGDYEAVGVPMLPNVSGIPTTKNQIVVYAVLTAIFGVVPAFMGFASFGYGVVAAVLGAIFVHCSIAVWRMADGDVKMVPAKKLFGFSIFYLFAIFSALLIDRLVAVLISGGAGGWL